MNYFKSLFLVSFLFLAIPSFASAAPLDPSPTSVDYGDLGRYLNSPGQNVGFTNNNLSAVQVTSAYTTGSFYTNSNGCNGAYLNPGDTCFMDVYASADGTLGVRNGTIEVSDGIDTVSVPLTVDVVTGTLSPNPVSMNYPAQPWYNGGSWQNLSVGINTYGVSFSQATITGPDAAAFSLSGDGCSNNFYFAAQTCYIGVQYNPTTQGAEVYNATLTVVSDADNDPVVIPLQAESLAGPNVEFSPTTIDFGNVFVGSSRTETIEITNTGDSNLLLQQILIISSSASYFPVSNNGCALVQVPPNTSCTFDITYAPQKPGDREASVYLITNTPSPIAQVPLSGNAFYPSEAFATLTGIPRVGETLACQADGTNGEVESIRWLRDGEVIGGAKGVFYLVRKADDDHRIACRVTVSNPLSESIVESNPVGPIESDERTATELRRAVCRTVSIQKKVRVAGTLVTIGGGYPTTGLSPLTFSADRPMRVRLAGESDLKKVIQFAPRQLNSLANGEYGAEITIEGKTKTVDLILSDCDTVVQPFGQRRTLKLILASKRPMKQARFDLSRLRIKEPVRGQFTFISPGGRETFPINENRKRYNGVKLEFQGNKIVATNMLKVKKVFLRIRTIDPIKGKDAGSIEATAVDPQNNKAKIWSPIRWRAAS